MILFFLLSFRPFPGSGLIKIPAVPGGPGILINPSGSWTSSRSSIRTSSDARPSRPLGPVRFSGCFGGFFRFSSFAFPVFCVFRKPGWVLSVAFFGLVAVSLFGVRAVCSWAFLGFSGGVSCLLCCLALLHLLIYRKRALPVRRPQWRPTPHPL